MSCDNAEVRCSTLNLCAGARNAATCGFEFLHRIAFRLACPSCPACGAPGAQPKRVGVQRSATTARIAADQHGHTGRGMVRYLPAAGTAATRLAVSVRNNDDLVLVLVDHPAGRVSRLQPHAADPMDRHYLQIPGHPPGQDPPPT